MPKIPFARGAYRRDNGSLPELRVVNMFVERTPTAEGELAIISRKGLSEHSDNGAGPVSGLFQRDGAFDGATFELNGNLLLKDGVSLGAVPGPGPVSMATSGVELVVTAGLDAYSYDGTDLQAISFPDGSKVLAVDYLGGRFVFVPEDPPAGNGAFYWSDTNDGRTVDGLSFATAESSPDGLYDVKAVRGNLHLLGANSGEMWRVTSDADLPFQLIQQTISAKGAIGTGCAAEADNALHWITNDGFLVRWGEVPEILGDSGLAERIRDSATRRLLRFDYEAHPLVCVVLDDDVFAYDASTRELHSLASYGLTRFRAACAINIGTSAYLGDETTGQVWTFDGWEDDGGPLERLFTAYFGINTGSVPINNLWIEANVGRTDLLAGQGSDPVCEMRSSNDAGATWSDWEAADLGEQGEYRVICEWRALGLFDVPGAMFEFRVTDPVGFRVSGVHVNDPIPGRSR